MIEDKFKVEKREKEDYPLIPLNVYKVELIDVKGEENETYDSRMNPSTEKEMETVFTFKFKFLEGVDDKGKSIIGVEILKRFVPNYFWIGSNGKNPLYKIVEAFLGRDLTEEEVNTFEASKLNALVGKQIKVGVEHKETPKGIYCNINAFYPANPVKPAMGTNDPATTDPDSVKYPPEQNPEMQGDVPIIQVDEDNGAIPEDQIPF